MNNVSIINVTLSSSYSLYNVQMMKMYIKYISAICFYVIYIKKLLEKKSMKPNPCFLRQNKEKGRKGGGCQFIPNKLREYLSDPEATVCKDLRCLPQASFAWLIWQCFFMVNPRSLWCLQMVSISVFRKLSGIYS